MMTSPTGAAAAAAVEAAAEAQAQQPRNRGHQPPLMSQQPLLYRIQIGAPRPLVTTTWS
jgi:hypothetical protein